MTVQLQLYPASFLGFTLCSHHSASEQTKRSSLARPHPLDIFMTCLCIKLNVDRNNGPEFKGSQSQQTVCIFSMCVARPGCWSELPGWTRLLRILFPLVCAMSSPSSQGPWACPRHFEGRGQPHFPLPWEKRKSLRTQVLIAALQRNWRSVGGRAGDGHLLNNTKSGINPYQCLWALLASSPFLSLLVKQRTL